MTVNIGATDRVIRIILAILMLILAFTTSIGNGMKIILFIVAAVVFLTGVTGICMLYNVIGVNTCKKKTE